MVKSIQYFNEKSVPIFEKLEDEFLRDPSDIASYVTKLTEELHKTGIRMIEETLSYLDEMINESEARKLSWEVDRHETKQLIMCGYSFFAVIFLDWYWRSYHGYWKRYFTPVRKLRIKFAMIIGRMGFITEWRIVSRYGYMGKS